MKHIKSYYRLFESKENQDSIFEHFLGIQDMGFTIEVSKYWTEKDFDSGGYNIMDKNPFKDSYKLYQVNGKGKINNDDVDSISLFFEEMSEIKQRISQTGKVYFEWNITEITSVKDGYKRGESKSFLTFTVHIVTDEKSDVEDGRQQDFGAFDSGNIFI